MRFIGSIEKQLLLQKPRGNIGIIYYRNHEKFKLIAQG